MTNHVKFACPMDCFDACSLIATVEDNRVTGVRPDPDHPMTRGKCCRKGLKVLERLYHPRRLKHPLKRHKNEWMPISWDEAIATLADELASVKATFGPLAVLHYADSGYGGLIKTVDEMFFNHFGGVTKPRGSLCWAAGMAAQRFDFGDAISHRPEDFANAKTIILWGRNPVATNMHLIPYLVAARKSGAEIVLIDPVKTESHTLADHHLTIRPATDGALALGLAQIIIKKDLLDRSFVENHVKGFAAFAAYAARFTPKRVAAVTGMSTDTIRWLALRYGQAKPSAIVLGYGPQRYQNGGNTIRCIDALGAITGNIGVAGGGVNYADRSMRRYIGGEVKESRRHVQASRTFVLPQLAEFLMTANDPPIQSIFILKANPLVQIGHINKSLRAWHRVPFKVVFDMFMTDTARHADMVLPCTSILEEEDLVYTSMFSPYLNISNRAVDPPEGVRSEYEVFKQLARALGLTTYPYISRAEFLKRAIAPLTDAFGLTLDHLQSAPFALPGKAIAWQDKKFATPSGKYELVSDLAAEAGQSPLPQFVEPAVAPDEFPLRLITAHWKDSMHSQHFAFIDTLPKVYINPETAAQKRLVDGQRATIATVNGELTVSAKTDNRIPVDCALIYQGWWHHSGSVNFLTMDNLSDMGEQAAYNDCFCRLTTD